MGMDGRGGGRVVIFIGWMFGQESKQGVHAAWLRNDSVGGERLPNAVNSLR